MKKINFLPLVISLFLGLSLISCDDGLTATVNFEDVDLDTNGYLKTATFTSGNITFTNIYNTTYDSWSGFACSSLTDKTTATFSNDLSVYGKGGASGSKFAVTYSDAFSGNASFSFTGENTEFVIKDISVTNGTYPYLSIKNGNDVAKKFASGDWFKLIIIGYDANNIETGRVNYYLADFRNCKNYICNTWKKVDLKSLGFVHKIEIAFESSDVGDFGINTPTYVCIDDIRYYLPAVE